MGGVECFRRRSARRLRVWRARPSGGGVRAVLLAGLVLLGSLSGEGGGAEGAQGKKRSAKETRAAASERRGIDTSTVWRKDVEVFSVEQLVTLEPILRASRCRNAKVGCLYLENGRRGTEARYAFRVIPWKVSKHPGYLVRNDRCGAGGCDEGLFVLIDGRWRLLTETFGVLERDRSSTHGFRDLVFIPRGQAPIRLEWDGRAYREVLPAN